MLAACPAFCFSSLSITGTPMESDTQESGGTRQPGEHTDLPSPGSLRSAVAVGYQGAKDEPH